MTITTEGRACADLRVNVDKTEWSCIALDWKTGCGEPQNCLGLHRHRLCTPRCVSARCRTTQLTWLKTNLGQVLPFPSRRGSGQRCGFERGASPAHLLHWLPRAASSRWGPGCQWGKPCGWPGRPPGRHGAGMSHLGCPLPGSSPQSYPWILQGQQKTEYKTLQASQEDHWKEWWRADLAWQVFTVQEQQGYFKAVKQKAFPHDSIVKCWLQCYRGLFCITYHRSGANIQHISSISIFKEKSFPLLASFL